MDWMPIIGYLGIGTLLKGCIDHFLNSKAKISDRAYSEERESYTGLLEALREAAANPSNATAKRFALWQARCCLFGSNDVQNAAQKLIDTNDDRKIKEGNRTIAYQELIQSMRRDLGSH